MTKEEFKASLQPMLKMKEQLVEWCKAEVDKGKEQIDGKELGDAIDMIKDLADAHEKCWKAFYYETVVTAMSEVDDDEPDDDSMPIRAAERMGYNRRRYPSSGRYASAGHGMRMGYLPPDLPKRMMPQTDMPDYPRMDYRMGYSEDPKELVMTLRDIWASAEPEQRKKLKEDLTALMQDMK